jgi:hypothetical protein
MFSVWKHVHVSDHDTITETQKRFIFISLFGLLNANAENLPSSLAGLNDNLTISTGRIHESNTIGNPHNK